MNEVLQISFMFESEELALDLDFTAFLELNNPPTYVAQSFLKGQVCAG